MRNFLYISPYFPPQTKVGALRPLKFVRHLSEHDWSPVVLADLGPNDGMDRRLNELVPESCKVVWDYSHRAARTWQAFQHNSLPDSSVRSNRQTTASNSGLGKAIRRAAGLLPMPGPEFLPLGSHSPHMLHALKAGRRVLKEHPCQAIVVNADPYAACLVGRKLGLEFNLPVIQDLRDPWALCDLRRPLRPYPQRRIVDRMERLCIQDCARFIVNTRTTWESYVSFYHDIPSQRFSYIRNHADVNLISGGSYTPDQRYTLLFMGNFRRFVEGTVLLDVLAELKRRGFSSRNLVLKVSGNLPGEALDEARRLGVEDLLESHPFVPYYEVGSFMAAADLLVSLSNASRQRIPAKLYDYATNSRPLLAIGDNLEVETMLDAVDGVTFHGLHETASIADSVAAEMGRGRHRTIDRSQTELDSTTATGKLASILDEVTGRSNA
jgi:hypothetical protein